MTLNCFAQTAEWLWARSATGNAKSISSDMVTDKDANVYVTGYFTSAPVTFSNFTLKNLGNEDSFLVKYNSEGDVLWATGIGGPGDEETRSVTTDSKGNIYVTGYFSSDSLIFGSTVLHNYSGYDVFIVKYNPDGKVLWAEALRGQYQEYSWNMVSDTDDNIYISVACSPGEIFLGNKLVTTFTNNGMLLIKCTSDGEYIWSKSVNESVLQSVSFKICIDSTNNVYVSGLFQEPVLLIENDTLLSGGGIDIFVVKYDSNGKKQWARTIGGEKTEINGSIITDNRGHLYISGSFTSTILNVGTIVLEKYNQSRDVFLAKYDDDGNVMWAKYGQSQFAGYGINYSDTSLFTGGSFIGSPIIVGSDTLKNVAGTSPMRDIFVAKYDSSGTAMWGISAGGVLDELTNKITKDKNGNIYILGSFTSPLLSFGNIALERNNDSLYHVFIAKLKTETATSILPGMYAESISLYPNPMKSTFHILGIEDGSYNISIYSLAGEEVLDVLLETSHSIDLSGNAKGTYIYQLTKYNKVVKTGKLILE